MFSSTSRSHLLAAASLIIIFGANGCTGGCSCAAPYPPGVVMPENLILENGIQIRLTEQGFDFVEMNMAAIMGSLLGTGGLCLPAGAFSFLIDLNYCNMGTCSDGSTGCAIGLDLNTIDFTLAAPNDIDVYFDLSLDINLNFEVDCGFAGNTTCASDCDLGGGSPACSTPAGRNNRVHADNIMATVTMALTNDATTRHLNMEVADVNIGSLNLSVGSFAETGSSGICLGCGAVEVVGDLLTGLVSFLGPLIGGLFTGTFDSLVQGFVPDPPGMEGVMSVTDTLGFPPPGGVPALLEFSDIAGGDPAMGTTGGVPPFVNPDMTSGANGLTLGMRAGSNSDVTITDMDGRSTPHPCVPARTFVYPNEVGTIPGRTDRTLPFAAEFTNDSVPGMMTGYDVGIGIAESTIDALAFNFFNGGGLCIAIGSNTIALVDTGTFGLLIASLSELTHGNNSPMLLALRPLQPPDVTIGVGAAIDPNDKLIQVYIPELAIDMYAFVEERYVRIFTMTVDVGVDLDLDVLMNCPPGGGPCTTQLVPVFDGGDIYFGGGCGIGGGSPCVTNNELLSENPTDLEALLPMLIGLAAPFISGAISPFDIPNFNGFLLNIQALTRTVGNLPGGATHNFLSIFATLDFDAAAGGMLSYDLDSFAEIGAITLPPPGIWSAEAAKAARHEAGALKPSVSVSVDGYGGPAGAAYEWQYRVDGGFWSPFISERTHEVTDPMLWLQGRHSIEVRTRLIGDNGSWDRSPALLEVNIDNLPPKVSTTWDDDADVLRVATMDAASSAGELLVEARWPDGTVTVLDATREIVLSAVAGGLPSEIVVTDPAGNTTSRAIDPRVSGFHENAPVGGGGGGGCNCTVVVGESNSPKAPLLVLLFGLFSFGLVRRPRRSGRGAGPGAPSGADAPGSGSRSVRGAGMFLAALTTLVIFGSGITGCAGCCKNDPANCEDECPEGGSYDDITGMCICNSTTCAVDQDCADVMCLSGFPYCNAETMMCDCYPLVPPAKPGRYSEIGVFGGTAYISAYSDALGDLMVGTVSAAVGGSDRPISCTTDADCPTGRACDQDRDHDLTPETCSPGIVWTYVDGVPDVPPSSDPAGERGGITDPGENVGLYTSIALDAAGNPRVSYYDASNGDLKLAYYDGTAWNVTTVDTGLGFGADVGMYTSLTLDTLGNPGIAYFARSVDDGMGNEVTQARFAMASTSLPMGPSSWTVFILDEAPVVLGDPKGGLAFLPFGTGLFNSAARLPDGTPAVTFYDRITTSLKLSVFDPTQGAFLVPTVLDGGDDGMGNDLGDMGQWCSLAVDATGNFHVSYVDATQDDLVYLYVDAATGAGTREIVDDGFKTELAVTGEEVPVFALLGEDSSIVLDGEIPGIVYQDATFLDLIYATRDAGVVTDPSAAWVVSILVGNDPKFYLGAQGFYADQVLDGGSAVISTWVIDATLDPRYTGMSVMNRVFSGL